jgi:hypothetical protein
MPVIIHECANFNRQALGTVGLDVLARHHTQPVAPHPIEPPEHCVVNPHGLNPDEIAAADRYLPPVTNHHDAFGEVIG